MEEKIFISLTKSELQFLISEAVNNAIAKLPRQNNVPDPNLELLNIRQVAELLHLSVPTIYGYTANATIPHLKKGKRLYFNRSKVMEWLGAK